MKCNAKFISNEFMTFIWLTNVTLKWFISLMSRYNCHVTNVTSQMSRYNCQVEMSKAVLPIHRSKLWKSWRMRWRTDSQRSSSVAGKIYLKLTNLNICKKKFFLPRNPELNWLGPDDEARPWCCRGQRWRRHSKVILRKPKSKVPC
jgi:hypothetical protein